MPVFRLTKRVAFPPANLATEDGLLAVGGDLSVDRLLLAYREGIFPWPSDNTPLLWWSPDPRMVLFLDEFHCSKRLRRVINSGVFRVTADTAFDQVIRHCATVPREGQDGTWITDDMAAAYTAVHHAGYAHSIETWRGDTLVGGLYGISLGACFFGESMFALEADASKVAMARLVERLRMWNFGFIDCQVHTAHLARLGARNIPRGQFLRLLENGLETPTRVGPWSMEGETGDPSRD